ncbi:MAG: hypothetical protein KDA24_13605 [Deltaproteobacteria bacterium]|nr:hypothetical protein [Deltaproteobacteria bacterium]
MHIDLPQRLAPFIASGLVETLPTPWQLRQGELEMAPWVISTDVTDEEAYRRTPLAHPIARQPLLLSTIGLDHFAMGSGLASSLDSVIKHLHLTWHSGFPLFDLQLVQTHEHGLEWLRASLEEARAGATRRGRRLDGIARRLYVDPDGYYDRFLAGDGWIARAEAFDYPTPESEGCAMPPEFFGLVPFVNHCAQAYPATLAEVGFARVPWHALRLLSTRFRTVGGFGWGAAARRLLQ